MIIWQGYGFIAILIPLLLASTFQAIHNDLFVFGWLLGGIILYYIGKKLHNPETNDIILHDENGQGYKFKKHVDTLFFIPIEYVGIIMAIFSIISIVSIIIGK
ncbi:MAG: hypothetical protein NC191_02765 [Muribaculaceae bacterium]|nr:hypothetical protein [Muribaculaceae bacterium]